MYLCANLQLFGNVFRKNLDFFGIHSLFVDFFNTKIQQRRTAESSPSIVGKGMNFQLLGQKKMRLREGRWMETGKKNKKVHAQTTDCQ